MEEWELRRSLPEKFSSLFLLLLTQFTGPSNWRACKILPFEKYNEKINSSATTSLSEKFRLRLFRCRSLLPNNGRGSRGGLGRWPSSWTSWQWGRATTGHSKLAKRGGDLGVTLPVCVHIWINYCFDKRSVLSDQSMEYQFYFFLF